MRVFFLLLNHTQNLRSKIIYTLAECIFVAVFVQRYRYSETAKTRTLMSYFNCVVSIVVAAAAVACVVAVVCVVVVVVLRCRKTPKRN